MRKGDEIVSYSIQHDRVWDAKASLLVEDEGDEVVLWMPAGSQFAVPRNYREDSENFRRNRWINFRDNDWQLSNQTWIGNHVLTTKKLENFYSVMHFWREADGEFLGYYINFELPSERSEFGFKTLDLDLDIMIYPDFRWQMKDEEDYQNGIDIGGIRPEWAAAISAAKTSVLADMEARRYPFDGRWVDYPTQQTFNRVAHFPKPWAQQYDLLQDASLT